VVKEKSREIEMRKEMAKVPSFEGLDAKKFRGSKQTDRREGKVDRAEKSIGVSSNHQARPVIDNQEYAKRRLGK